MDTSKMMQTPVQPWQGKSGGGSTGLTAFERQKLSEYYDPGTQLQMQNEGNRNYAETNAAYNRYNTNGPLGSTYWTRNGDTWTENTKLSDSAQQLLDSGLVYSKDTTDKLIAGNQRLNSLSTDLMKSGYEDAYKGIKAPDLTKYYKKVDTSLPDYYKNINVNGAFKRANSLWEKVNTNVKAAQATAGTASAGTATAGQAADTWGDVSTEGVGRGSESITNYLQQMQDSLGDYRTNYADIQGDEAVRQQVIDALNARMQPSIDRDRAALESKLINQGVRPGTNVYSAQQQAQNQQINDARMAAIAAGGDALAQQVQTEATARAANLFQSRQNQDIANELWQQQADKAKSLQQNEYDLFAVDQANKELQAQQQIAKATGQGNINIANAGYQTDASIANANNQTGASIANANNQTNVSITNANNTTNTRLANVASKIAKAQGISQNAATKLTAKLTKAQGRTDRKISLTNNQIALATALAQAGQLSYEDKLSLATIKTNARGKTTADVIALQNAIRGG